MVAAAGAGFGGASGPAPMCQFGPVRRNMHMSDLFLTAGATVAKAANRQPDIQGDPRPPLPSRAKTIIDVTKAASI